MKKIGLFVSRWFLFFRNNGSILFQCVVLLAAVLLPYTLSKTFLTEIDNISNSEINDFIFYIYSFNRLLCSILLVSIALYYLRKDNCEKVFCYKNKYHNYPYVCFLVARFLGIKKCSLVRVPIGLQYKLLIKSTFSEYITEELTKDECSIVVREEHSNKKSSKICIVISDTYSISVRRQIPDKLKNYGVIHIARVGGNYRAINKQLVEKVTDVVNNLPKETDEVLLFATTNPLHNQLIAKACFTCAGRGRIKWLTVYQQDSDENRTFSASSYWRMRV